MRILIAEDDRTSRDWLRAILGKLGHEVTVTVDGEEAWQKLQSPEAPRLVVLDWMMPKMDGLDVCRRVREREGDSVHHIILLTQLSEREQIAAGLDAGANDYLVKPVDPLELRARVDAGARMLAMHAQLAAKNEALREALAHIKTLHGIIPICMHCKRIRDGENYWRRVEEYVSANTDAKFSHGLCTECYEEHYAGLDDTDPDGAK